MKEHGAQAHFLAFEHFVMTLSVFVNLLTIFQTSNKSL